MIWWGFLTIAALGSCSPLLTEMIEQHAASRLRRQQAVVKFRSSRPREPRHVA